ncbi:MAG: 3-dehydroquinate synthase, partial [Planctomycetes bacterium]|nr:3-dehydroquinate synthase [Planctomycetota bacterium]
MPEILLKPRRPLTGPSRLRCRRGLFADIPETLDELGSWDSVHLLHDDRLTGQAMALEASVHGLQRLPHVGGETSKCLAEIESLALRLLEQRATRRSLLIVLGGGTLCDLGGFLASIFLRGIDCLLVPSTVLAMADAAVGGKNGVDLIDYKNILGTIRQPEAVLIDPELLESLPNIHFREGLVEIVKAAMILESASFDWIEENLDRVLRRETAAVDEAIWTGVRLKAEVVRDDELEADRRLLLNFGHTIGHALETASDFDVSHGQAVAIGMPIEMRMARAQETARLIGIIDRLGFGDLEMPFSAAALWKAMQNDKKRTQGAIRVAVPRRIGVGKVSEVTLQDL